MAVRGVALQRGRGLGSTRGGVASEGGAGDGVRLQKERCGVNGRGLIEGCGFKGAWLQGEAGLEMGRGFRGRWGFKGRDWRWGVASEGKAWLQGAGLYRGGVARAAHQGAGL